MESNDIRFFYDLLNNQEYCLLYNGNFIDTVTSKIINITKVSLIQRGVLIKTQNRFAYLIAECFQNIIRHGGHKEHDLKEAPLPGFFMAKIRDSYYDIVTGNLIDKDKITPLKILFDDVNKLNNEELKALYKKALAEGELSDKGGAGLGLIDMAKKSAEKLEYRFFDYDNHNSMFYQRVVMSSDIDKSEAIKEDQNIEFGINLHKTMIRRNMLMLQKSDFSRDSVLPILRIVEKNVISNSNDSVSVQIIYQILMELIQNIKTLELQLKGEKESIFFISKNEDKYTLCSGHFVDTENIKHFENFINEIKSMTNKELLSSYLSKIKTTESQESEPNTDQTKDLDKIISENFSFRLNEIDNLKSFFNIIVVL